MDQELVILELRLLMEFNKILANILGKDEEYKIFKTLWNSRKSFPLIKKNAKIKGISIKDYNNFLNIILNRFKLEYEIIDITKKKNKKYYSLNDLGKRIKEAFSNDIEELLKTRSKDEIMFSLLIG